MDGLRQVYLPKTLSTQVYEENLLGAQLHNGTTNKPSHGSDDWIFLLNPMLITLSKEKYLRDETLRKRLKIII